MEPKLIATSVISLFEYIANNMEVPAHTLHQWGIGVEVDEYNNEIIVVYGLNPNIVWIEQWDGYKVVVK